MVFRKNANQEKMNQEKAYVQALGELQETMGLRFTDPDLLLEAFVHRSFLNENPSVFLRSNERLEFLGDAVIGFIITERLFKQFPLLSEGEMTRLRSQIVCQEGLSALARQIGLGKYLLLSRGESLTGGRDRDSNLARTFEALVGALYLDRGLPAAKDFLFSRITAEGLLALMVSETFDFKSRLQEFAQAKFQLTPVYETVKEEGPPHDRNFFVRVRLGDDVAGTGEGKSKKKAEEEAAKYALENLTGH